jgi:hypothetical protein
MPREGIFGVVLEGGNISVGDTIEMQDKFSEAAAVIGTKETEATSGDDLKRLISKKFNPAFIRFDTMSEKEGGSLAAILQDLTTTQRIKNIIIFDPSGTLGLSLLGSSGPQDRSNHFEKNGSIIDYCRTMEELAKI